MPNSKLWPAVPSYLMIESKVAWSPMLEHRIYARTLCDTRAHVASPSPNVMIVMCYLWGSFFVI